MLNKLRAASFLIRRFGVGWLAGRIWYNLGRRLGLLRLKMPPYAWNDRPLSYWFSAGIPSEPDAYAPWRERNHPGFFFDELSPAFSAEALPEAGRILHGELKFFHHAWRQVGFPPDWNRDPLSGAELDSQVHWSQLSNDGTGDIKFIWEASRFDMTYTLVRAYASARDEKFPEAFWSLIHSWADANPPNRGPNWMDGQECALRLMAWTFGLHAFKNSPASTPERTALLVTMIAAHAERIDKNIGFALSTRGNHAITEAMGLWLAGLMFPELRHAGKYLSKGRKLLEREASYQLFPDGTYSMYSLNYHRFVLQIYLYAMRLSEINRVPFSSQLQESISASVEFFTQLIAPKTGEMPVFGSNDGAQAYALNSCDFNDYRPVSQLGHCLLYGERLFEKGPWDEDLYWLCGAEALNAGADEISQEKGSFPDGGVYILRDLDSKAVIRCSDYRERPSHADQLHLDLWMRGHHVVCDAGTFLYTGEGIWRNGLARTPVHNTVTVDGLDQMDMLSRFTWVDWAKAKVLREGDFEGLTLWQGEHDGYQRLADPVTHRRTVMNLGSDRWLVLDHLTGKRSHDYRLQWLLTDLPYERDGNWFLLQPGTENIRVAVGAVEMKADPSIVRCDPDTTRGWRSRHYGHKEAALSIVLKGRGAGMSFWSYFGFGGDQITQVGNGLQVRFGDRQLDLDLQKLGV